MGLLTEFEKIANARHHGGSQQGGLMTSGIEWSNNDGAKVSHCGNYRINATGWDRGRKSIYQLRVKLVDLPRGNSRRLGNGATQKGIALKRRTGTAALAVPPSILISRRSNAIIPEWRKPPEQTSTRS